MQNKDIIFFDGQCNLCDRFVNFVFKRDPGGKKFRYAPLQGSTAKELLHKEDIESLKYIVFFQKGQALREALAIKAVMRKLYPRRAFLFSILPLFFFNFLYRLIAKRRYIVFGKKDHLYQPSEEQKACFLP